MLNFSLWLRLPIQTRLKIAEQFGIARTKPTHVINNELAEDGFALKDIEEGLSLEKLQGFLGSTETDVNLLWTLMVDLMEGRNPEVRLPENAPIQILPAEPVGTIKIKKVVKRNGKKSTKSK